MSESSGNRRTCPDEQIDMGIPSRTVLATPACVRVRTRRFDQPHSGGKGCQIEGCFISAMYSSYEPMMSKPNDL
jgi:hypothetical protein